MLYVLTQTLGLSSLGWSPTGFHTAWTTHRQNGDNLIYSSCTLGTYRGRFCIVWADKGKRGYPRCEEFPRLHGGNSGVCPRFTQITNTHTHTHIQTHTHTHTHTHMYRYTQIVINIFRSLVYISTTLLPRGSSLPPPPLSPSSILKSVYFAGLYISYIIIVIFKLKASKGHCPQDCHCDFAQTPLCTILGSVHFKAKFCHTMCTYVECTYIVHPCTCTAL